MLFLAEIGAGTVILSIVILMALALLVMAMVRKLLYICPPNEVLIFSGARKARPGQRGGYKIIKGGRKIRVPLFEVVDRMDLTNMPIDLEVKGAYSRGGIPLNVVGIANVKVAGSSPILDNAVERFLGKPRSEIMEIAKDTLEGNLRGVLATLTPEEVNEDKIKFAQALLAEAAEDLNRLGLNLDTLKIQDVSDDVKYLDSIGRRRSAEIQRKALIAEAENRSAAAVRDAENMQDTELKRVDAQKATVTAENQRRITDAVTRGEAMVAEERGKVAATLAQANAEVDVQTARIERERRRLSADVLEPARADKAAKENDAKGAAARIVEQGRAEADAMRSITTTWKAAGVQARDVLLVQKLEPVMREVLGTMGDLSIDKVTMLGLGSGEALEGGERSLTRRLIEGNEQLKAALGVDVAQALVTKLGGGDDDEDNDDEPPPPPPPPSPPPQARLEAYVEPPADHGEPSSGGGKPRPKRKKRKRR
jgi:flotillin